MAAQDGGWMYDKLNEFWASRDHGFEIELQYQPEDSWIRGRTNGPSRFGIHDALRIESA